MIEHFSHITNSPEDSIVLGEKIATYLKKGDILGLVGDLGTGKTTFVKGILKGLKYNNTVTSPTFTLINEYNAAMNVMHVDFYREENIERWKNMGFEEMMYKSDLVIIEWANLIPQLLPEDISTIRFEHINLNERRIYLK
tara:strand:+ start:575 stop:994 length:420 start_codon:yes stop_codon:yes gene_type:complete